MRKIFLFACLITLTGMNHLLAQDQGGTDFWVSFGRNPDPRPVYTSVKVVTKNACTVSLSFTANPNLDFSQSLNAGEVWTYVMNESEKVAVYNSTGTKGISNLSLRITSSDSIKVYALNQMSSGSVDATHLLPISAWGMDYYQISYKPTGNTGIKDGYILIAKENNTQVYDNDTLLATLNAGEIYTNNIPTREQLTGHHITSDKPVAFFVANEGALVPGNSIAYDILFEQLPPVDQWGTRFVVPNTIQQKARIRIMASQNGTDIIQVGAGADPILSDVGLSTGSQNSFTNLQAGQFIELEIDNGNGCYITANKPIGVCSYMVCQNYVTALSSEKGDPSLVWIPPIEQSVRHVLVSPFIATYTNNLTQHYALIMTPTSEKNNTTLSINGGAPATITDITWTDNVGGSGYSFGSYKFSNLITNYYEFDNPNGLFLAMYGIGNYDSYYCVAGGGIRDLTASFTVNDEDYLSMKGKAFCGVSDFEFAASFSGSYPASFTWSLDGNILTDFNNNPIVAVTGLSNGMHAVSLSMPSGEGFKTLSTYFFIGEGVVFWTPEANTEGTVIQRQDWNNSENWTPNIVPSSCIDVHIPGNCMFYPILNDTTNATCNNIYFHFGGELAKPHLLTYNKAYVQYNFGYFDSTAYKTDGDPYSTTPMRRGQWYALATPLKKITPGDFSFGGFPSAWQQGFVRRKTDMGTFSGEWTMPHNANATDIGVSQSHGISIWMADIAPGVIGEDEEYQANLNGLKGVVQLPFFEEEDTLGGPHRIHTYDGTSSRFYYYWNLDPQQTIEMTMYDQIARGDEGYRFVFDNELTTEIIDSKPLPVFTMDVPAGEEVMIGNPFVSNMDFDKFFELNRSKLKNGTYRMYVDNTWVDYTYGIGSGTLTPYIAPLQAFFIETAGSDTIQLLFPPDSLSVANPLNKLRTGNVRDSGNFYDDVVYVEAENDEGESWLTLVLAKSDNLVVENVQRLFNYNERYAGVPQIYSLYNGQKNSVQLLDEESEIPVGIHSNSKKSMTLRFHNLDRQHVSSLKLYDQVENVTYDLLDGDSEIRFLNTPDISERFILRVGNQTSGIGETIQDEKETEVRIFMEGNRLNVRSNEGIDKVAVISVQGLKIADISMAGSAYSLSTELETTPGVYIVRVLLINGKTHTEKIILIP